MSSPSTGQAYIAHWKLEEPVCENSGSEIIYEPHVAITPPLAYAGIPQQTLYSHGRSSFHILTTVAMRRRTQHQHEVHTYLHITQTHTLVTFLFTYFRHDGFLGGTGLRTGLLDALASFWCRDALQAFACCKRLVDGLLVAIICLLVTVLLLVMAGLVTVAGLVPVAGFVTVAGLVLGLMSVAGSGPLTTSLLLCNEETLAGPRSVSAGETFKESSKQSKPNQEPLHVVLCSFTVEVGVD